MYYLNYNALQSDQRFAADDSITLLNLAQLCPDQNGSCVYQARALYNSIYHQVLNSNDCSGGSLRIASSKGGNNRKSEKSNTALKFDVFPNPAGRQITIVSRTAQESMNIEIVDFTGRIVLSESVRTNNFICHLSLSLLEGIYSLTISNDKHDKINKKLVIIK